MIRLEALVGVEGNGLSLQNNTLTLNKTIHNFILIEKELNLCVLAGASAKILDVSEGSQIHIEIQAGASLEYQAFNTKNISRTVSCSGEFKMMEICLEESHEELKIELLKEFASAEVELLTLASESSFQFIQRIEHKAKQTTSNISNFGVALQKGDILFDTTGKIYKGMSKSKCVQLSKGIVMDDISSVTSKPILLIDEFDVIANHAASIGKMSDESLFYLMSRGLTKQEAFLLMLEGIVRPFIDKLTDEEVKNQFEKKIETILKR